MVLDLQSLQWRWCLSQAAWCTNKIKRLSTTSETFISIICHQHRIFLISYSGSIKGHWTRLDYYPETRRIIICKYYARAGSKSCKIHGHSLQTKTLKQVLQRSSLHCQRRFEPYPHSEYLRPTNTIFNFSIKSTFVPYCALLCQYKQID